MECSKRDRMYYMLLSGAEKENFKMLSEEIGDKFTLDELINMPSRHSLNIYRYNGQNITTFLSKLPPMLDVALKGQKEPLREEVEPKVIEIKESQLKPLKTPKTKSLTDCSKAFESKYEEYLKKFKNY